MKSVKIILNQSGYGKQIQSEKWIQFSKQIRSLRDVCECCRQGDRQLQVHHLFYDPARDLWDYTNEELVVLCDTCHRDLHESLKEFRKHVFRYLTPRTLQVLNGALEVGLTRYNPLLYVHALAEFTGNEPLVNNHARAFGAKNSKEMRENQ